MELFAFDFQDHHITLMLDFDLQLERLFLDDALMSVRPLSTLKSVHSFDSELGRGQLSFAINPLEKRIAYSLHINDVEVTQAIVEMSEEAKAAIVVRAENGELVAQPQKEKGWVALGGIAFKLFKTIKVVKIALAAATLAVYSVLFSFEFALALIGVLVFHEYGHLRAMKKFGIPTKGMYLIPFVGGIALGEKPRTQWEDVYISLMGPVFGLLMTAVFFVIYYLTGSHFCGLVSSVSALVNLFNLIPVYPLDGGRVVKALVFSRRNYLALMSLLILSALCLVAAWTFGLFFLCFFIVLGVVDLVSAWSVPLAQDITPLKTYGIWFCVAWYLLVAAAFLLMILLIAHAGVPGSEIAMHILKS